MQMKMSMRKMTTQERRDDVVGTLDAYLKGGAEITEVKVETEVVEEPPEDGSPFMRKRPGRGRMITIQLEVPKDAVEPTP